MANCNLCNLYVDCNCVLINGLCSKCYRKQSNKVINQTIKCEYTLEDLENKVLELNNKETISKTEKYFLIVLNKQIEIFNEKPCKYKNILINIL